ncbi:MAG TPA: S49 family peptidase, partial [Cyclobacteriaceae bacterium]|nr:S49 family peptidase [Cyclobacteriaceae bacterium]
SKFMDDKLGITSEEVKTGEIGELFTMSRRLNETERNILQKQTDEIYEIFTGKAAADRKMSQDDLKKIASGRVWTGAQAKDNGLADVMGGFNDAVKIAANKAGVGEDYKIRFYPKPKPLLDRLMGDWEDNAKAKAMRNELGEYYPFYQQWQKVKSYQGIQTRMPVEFSVR